MVRMIDLALLYDFTMTSQILNPIYCFLDMLNVEWLFVTSWIPFMYLIGCLAPVSSFSLDYKVLRTAKATIMALTLSSHNFPTDRARELFKPSKEAESLRGSI